MWILGQLTIGYFSTLRVLVFLLSLLPDRARLTNNIFEAIVLFIPSTRRILRDRRTRS